MYEAYAKHDLVTYAAYHKEQSKLLQSASGGVATALYEAMLAKQGYVVGVSYAADFKKAEYVVVDNVEGIRKLKGSKYITPDYKNIFQDVKSLLEQNKKVLFIGLPCTVAALKKTIQQEDDNLLTCDLICHGPTLTEVHEDFVAFLEKKYKSKIVDFTVRHKKYGWIPPYVKATFENKKVYEKPFYDSEYGYAFSTLSCEKCYQCKFKGNNRMGDLLIGDFGGAKETDEFWNKNGVSAILVHTQKGLEFIKKMNSLELFETSFERIVAHNPSVIQSRKKVYNTDQFKYLLKEKGLFYAVKHTRSVKSKLAHIVKSILPTAFVTSIQRVINARN